MKMLTLILSFVILSPMSWSNSTDLDYSVTIAPANGDWFYLVVTGPEGVKKELGYDPESVNLKKAVLLGRKLEMALKSESLQWNDVSESLLKRIVGPTPENGYVEPSTVSAYRTIQDQVIKKYSVTIAPANGAWFYLVVAGPEGFKKKLGIFPESENLERAVLLGRKLEMALNSPFQSQSLKWNDISDSLLGRLTKPTPSNGYVEPSTVKAFETIQAQVVEKYSVTIAPANSGWFYLVVTGPEGIKKGLGYNPESVNLDRAVILGRKLQLALNSQNLKWVDVSEPLLARLTEPTPESGYVDPSTVKTYEIISIDSECNLALQ